MQDPSQGQQAATLLAQQATRQPQYGAGPPFSRPDAYAEMLDVHATLNADFCMLRAIVDGRRASVDQLNDYCNHVDFLNYQRVLHGWQPLYNMGNSSICISKHGRFSKESNSKTKYRWRDPDDQNAAAI